MEVLTDVPIARGLDELEPAERRRGIVRSVVVSAVSTTGIVTAYFLIPWEGRNGSSLYLRLAIALVVIVAVSVLAVRHVLRSEFPVLRAVEMVAVVVTFAIVVFASVYVLVSKREPSAFSEPLDRVDALYFSLTTSTTVGFGDINAKSDQARISVMVHMVANVVVLGVAARVLLNTARRRIQR